MIYAERGNRVKQISESEIQKYVEQGYKITDAGGNVIEDTVPLDIPTLRSAYKKHVEEIKALKAQIEFLNAELAKSSKAVKKEEEPVEEKESKKALVIEEQPKANKSKKAKVVDSAE